MRSLAAAVALSSSAACTHYAPHSTYGAASIVSQRPVGAPFVETTSTTDVAVGYGESNVYDGYGGQYASGAAAGSRETVRRTQCKQRVEIEYVQTVDTQGVVSGRAGDIAGSVVLGVVGLAVAGFAKGAHSFEVNRWESDYEFHQLDPSFFPHPGAYPEEPHGAYLAATGIAIGGALWLAYSFVALPKGPPPAPTRGERRWHETSYIEAQGCGLVPADAR